MNFKGSPENPAGSLERDIDSCNVCTKEHSLFVTYLGPLLIVSINCSSSFLCIQDHVCHSFPKISRLHILWIPSFLSIFDSPIRLQTLGSFTFALFVVSSATSPVLLVEMLDVLKIETLKSVDLCMDLTYTQPSSIRSLDISSLEWSTSPFSNRRSCIDFIRSIATVVDASIFPRIGLK